MASNTELNTGSGGDVTVTKERTHDGDAAKQQGVFLSGVTGTEGSYTFEDINGSAANGLEVDVTRVQGTVTVDLGANNDVTLATLPDTSGGDLAAIASAVGGTLTVDLGANNDVTVTGTVAVTQSGTWTLGANSGVDIGDVDVTSIIAGTGATNLGKAVDSAAGSTDTGVAVLAVRDDALTTLTPIDGDYVPLRVSSTGALHVTGSSGSTQYVEDTAHSSGDTGTMALAVRTDTRAALAGTTGDYTPLQTNASGDLRVEVSSYADSQVDDAAFATTTDSIAMIGAVATPTDTSVDADDGGALAMSLDRRLYTDSDIQINGTAVTGGAGAVGASTPRVTLASDDPAVALLGTMDTDTGNIASSVATVATNTAKGTSHYRNVDANAEAAIKGSAGTLHWIHAMNMTAAVAYLHLYNATTASVTPGTTTPDYTFPIPTAGSTNGAGFNIRIEQAFSTAITLVVTTTIDGSTGDPGTNGVFINAGYT